MAQSNSSTAVENPVARKRRRSRLMVFALIAIAIGAMLAPLSGYLYVAMADQGTGAQPQSGWQETNPRSEVWRDARQGVEGYSAVKSPGANVLISNTGERFRQLRNGPVSVIGPWVMALILLAIGLILVITGGTDVEKPLTGKRVPRWTFFDRFLHWLVAILFFVLAITGLSLLFGRAALIPLLGPEGFSAWASLAKIIHNYSGPLFVVGIVLMVISWLKYNLPTKVDFQWFYKGGLTGGHAPAGRMNGGEKAWFWFIATAGIVVCVTGVILVLPNLFEGRGLSSTSLLLHSSLAILWIGITFGHIYMATAGAKGSLEGMVKGDVSSEWAEQHHDLWYEEMKREGREFREQDATGAEGSSSNNGRTPA
ncbi:MAG: formate dehydrogenase subunit gamma [Wenzhouxiangellaceae bacterium]|nr:formate dehydrogenase subunit gamma [Wenzhouxiangellaceae bacterium]